MLCVFRKRHACKQSQTHLRRLTNSACANQRLRLAVRLEPSLSSTNLFCQSFTLLLHQGWCLPLLLLCVHVILSYSVRASLVFCRFPHSEVSRRGLLSAALLLIDVDLSISRNLVCICLLDARSLTCVCCVRVQPPCLQCAIVLFLLDSQSNIEALS
jgi:hypothetical protein